MIYQSSSPYPYDECPAICSSLCASGNIADMTVQRIMSFTEKICYTNYIGFVTDHLHFYDIDSSDLIITYLLWTLHRPDVSSSFYRMPSLQTHFHRQHDDFSLTKKVPPLPPHFHHLNNSIYTMRMTPPQQHNFSITTIIPPPPPPPPLPPLPPPPLQFHLHLHNNSTTATIPPLRGT